MTPEPTPAFTSIPIPTATPAPTLIPEPTRISPINHVDQTSFNFDSCSWIVKTTIGNAGFLQVIYTQSEGRFIEVPEGFTGLVDNDYRRQLWSWSEETQTATPFLQPPDALGPRLSEDLQWIVFRRDTEITRTSEIWIVDAEGRNESRLATISYEEVKQRNPDEDSEVAWLGYGWIPNTDKVFYYVELGGVYDTFALVDIHSGEQIQLVEPGTELQIAFAPDGSQVAILTTNKPPPLDSLTYGSQPAVLLNFGTLRLVDTTDGSVQFTLPTQIRNNLGYRGSQSLDYSPDGKYVVGFSSDGVVRLNTKDGAWQNIPLNYTIVSPYLGSLYSPTYSWVDNSTIMVPITNLPEGIREINDSDLRADPNASFTIWRVNLIDAVSQPIQTFTGYAPSVDISPNGNYMVFDEPQNKSGMSPDGSYVVSYQPNTRLGAAPPPNLILVDLNTGDILTTLERVYWVFWSSYSDLYLYNQLDEPVSGIPTKQVTYLGQIGEAPLLLGNYEFEGQLPLYIHWLDAKRFLMENGCKLWDMKLSSVP